MPSVQQQKEVFLWTTDLEACSCPLATDTTQDSATVAEKKGWIDRGSAAVAVMWAVVTFIAFILLLNLSHHRSPDADLYY